MSEREREKEKEDVWVGRKDRIMLWITIMFSLFSS